MIKYIWLGNCSPPSASACMFFARSFYDMLIGFCCLYWRRWWQHTDVSAMTSLINKTNTWGQIRKSSLLQSKCLVNTFETPWYKIISRFRLQSAYNTPLNLKQFIFFQTSIRKWQEIFIFIFCEVFWKHRSITCFNVPLHQNKIWT